MYTLEVLIVLQIFRSEAAQQTDTSQRRLGERWRVFHLDCQLSVVTGCRSSRLREESALCPGSEGELHFSIRVIDPVARLLFVRVDVREPPYPTTRHTLEVFTGLVEKGEIVLRYKARYHKVSENTSNALAHSVHSPQRHGCLV